MTDDLPPIRFGHHAVAVLASAMVAATAFSLLWTALLIGLLAGRHPEPIWLVMAGALCWLAVFITAFPVMAVALTLLFPVTRRRNGSARAVCLVAGVAIGIVLAPLGTSGWRGATPLQLLLFAATGLIAAAAYLIVGARLGEGARPPAAGLDGA